MTSPVTSVGLPPLHRIPEHAARHSPLLVLSGPSGVGKTRVVSTLRALRPDIWVSVSATTRFPRPGEVEGVHYHYLDEEAFDASVAGGDMLEWAAYAGNRYGTPRAPVQQRLAAGCPVLVEVEVQGARQIRGAAPEALLVFLGPPSWETLVRRLTGRGTETPQQIEARLDQAREELAAEPEFDVTLVNDEVDQVVADLVALLGLGPADSASSHRN